MPSKLYLRGDSDAIWLLADADLVVRYLEGVFEDRLEAVFPKQFFRFEMVPAGPEEPSRPIYVDPGEVAAVCPLDEREIRAEYADLPDWLEQT